MFDLSLNIRFDSSLDLMPYFYLVSMGVAIFIYWRLHSGFSVNSILYIFICLCVALVLLWLKIEPLNHDEVEHLHSTWMVSQGLIPYKDFWQHHSPLLWVLLAPLVNFLSLIPFYIDLSRVFSGCIFLLSFWLGWKVAVDVWKEKASFPMYCLFLLSTFLKGQYFYLRPDIFMNLYSLVGIIFTFKALEDKLLPLFFAGISFALGGSFVFKNFLLILLPLMFLPFLNNRKRSLVLMGAVYGAGLCVGILPLTLYLLKTNTLQEFVFWALKFNSKRISIGVAFPAILFCLTFFNIVKNSREEKLNKNFLVLSIAFVLVSIESLFTAMVFSNTYYLQLWFFICGIICCRLNVDGFLVSIKSNFIKALIITAIGMYFVGCVLPVLRIKFNKETAIISLPKGETCFCIVPSHPIFFPDITRLYTQWQCYRFLSRYTESKEDLNRQGSIVKQILNGRPIIFESTSKGIDIFDNFRKERIITNSDLRVLKNFLKLNYERQRLDGETYYIRKNSRVKILYTRSMRGGLVFLFDH